jgi:hypothetical protein
MTSEIDKLKHFHVENYSGTNFTDDLNDGEEFLYTTIRCKDDKEVTLLCKYVKNKHIGNCPNCIFNKYLCYGLLCNIVVLKVIKDEEMTASDYTHLFGYLNPYYRSAYNVSKRRK